MEKANVIANATEHDFKSKKDDHFPRRYNCSTQLSQAVREQVISPGGATEYRQGWNVVKPLLQPQNKYKPRRGDTSDGSTLVSPLRGYI